MGVYGVLYGDTRDPSANSSVCDVVFRVECTCGDVCHLYSHTYICYALTLPLTLLALFVIISIFLHAVMQDKRLECFAPLALTAALIPGWRAAAERWGRSTWGM
jgi:hypothetical protein